MTKLVGIVNVTPDSFSDGGALQDKEAVLAYVRQLIADGADIVDLGAESTRPGAVAMSAEEEWKRLLPVLEPAIALCHAQGVGVSVDSYHPQTAEQAITLGVDMINDVGGGRDEAMLEVVRAADCQVIFMHSLSIPADKTVVLAEEEDPMAVIQSWAEALLSKCDRVGIDRSRLVLDLGIGFGKTAVQSLTLLNACDLLLPGGVPLYVGHSRKSFLGLFTDAPAAQRDELTLAFSAMLMQRGVDYLRVHDVAAHARLREVIDGR